MIETPQQLASMICHDLVDTVAEWDGVSYIVSTVEYADGDSVVVYIDRARGGISDRGTTLFKLWANSITMSDDRTRIVEAICETHGVKRSGNEFFASLPDAQSPGIAFHNFCHAMTRIADMSLYVRPRPNHELQYQVDSLLAVRVSPTRLIDRMWCLRDRDPECAFPVDYRINGSGPARHLFHVASKQKCDRVAAVCNFLKAEGVHTPTMTVLRSDIEFGQQYLDRLQVSADDVVFGIEGNEERIVDFALAGQ